MQTDPTVPSKHWAADQPTTTRPRRRRHVVRVAAINGRPPREYRRQVRKHYAGKPEMIVGLVDGHATVWTGDRWNRSRLCSVHDRDCQCPKLLHAAATERLPAAHPQTTRPSPGGRMYRPDLHDPYRGELPGWLILLVAAAVAAAPFVIDLLR